MVSREQRLLDYIDSGGVKLPPDYREFQMGGARSDYCVFCGLPLEDYQNALYRKDAKTGAFTQEHCLCCDTCDSLISESFKARADRLNLSESARNRIKLYVEEGKFDPDHVRYKFDPRKVVALSDRPSSSRYCYFCERRGADSLRPVHAPVTASIERTGGIVGMCSDCEAYADSMWKTSWTTFDSVHWIKCDTCNASYTIHDEELSHRESTRYKYSCPRCVEATIQELATNAKSVYDERYRMQPLHRHTDNLKCAQCGITQVFDLYCERRALVAACPDATIVRCLACSRAVDALASEVMESSAFIVSVGGSYQIHINTTVFMGASMHGYEIYTASGQILQIVDTAFQSLESAVKDAVNYIVQHENSSKQ